MPRKLDIHAWKRRPHFELYQTMAQPFFNVCANVDVSKIWEQSRKDPSISFTLASLFLGSRAANSVEALRMRIRGNEVWVHDVVHFGTTVIRPDNTFAFARIEHRETFEEFARDGRAVIERARSSTGLEIPDGDDDEIYHSIIPWVHFTAFSNPIKGKGDSFPRVVFGKVQETEDRLAVRRHLMPVGVEVHHALVDGYDVGRFFEEFQKELNAGIPG